MGSADALCRFQCPTCVKGISLAQTYLFKPCGHVLCERCTTDFALPSKACPVCGASLAKAADTVKLQRGGSSFVAHEGTQSVVKKYRPALIS